MMIFAFSARRTGDTTFFVGSAIMAKLIVQIGEDGHEFAASPICPIVY